MAEYQVKIQQTKVVAIDALKDEFKDVKDFIFTDFRGLTVEQITDLRNKLREQDATYRVVKNRFAKIALKDLERPVADEYLTGPTAVALPNGESGPVAKILVEFSKNAPVTIKGGILDNNLFNAQQVVAFSRLPTRNELLASLMSTMRAPVQNIVYLLNAVPTKLVRTLQAVADKKE